MGQRGRLPATKAELQVRGDRRAAGMADDAEPPPGEPRKPAWLGAAGSAKWDEIIPELAAAGTLSPLFADFIAIYCNSFDDLSRADAILGAEGWTLTNDKGASYMHPAASLRLSAISRIHKFGRELGLSPAASRNTSKVKPKLSVFDPQKGRFFGKKPK